MGIMFCMCMTRDMTHNIPKPWRLVVDSIGGEEVVRLHVRKTSTQENLMAGIRAAAGRTADDTSAMVLRVSKEAEEMVLLCDVIDAVKAYEDSDGVDLEGFGGWDEAVDWENKRIKLIVFMKKPARGASVSACPSSTMGTSSQSRRGSDVLTRCVFEFTSCVNELTPSPILGLFLRLVMW